MGKLYLDSLYPGVCGMITRIAARSPSLGVKIQRRLQSLELRKEVFHKKKNAFLGSI
jgi:hypothetical protein